MTNTSVLFWFRRDLRLADNAGLYHALKAAHQNGTTVHLVFVFDTTILSKLPQQDRRVSFIWDCLQLLNERLKPFDAHIHLLQGNPTQLIPALAATLNAAAVYTNHDDEPQALQRDQAVRQQLLASGRSLQTYKDHVIFERSEIMTAMGTPYSVFTPYKNAWLKALLPFHTKPYPVEAYLHALAKTSTLKTSIQSVANVQEIGFDAGTKLTLMPGEAGAQALLEDFEHRIGRYEQARDFPSVKGPSYLSTHLRFGTISIRQCVAFALRIQAAQPVDALGASVWLSELIWRDFYHQIMYHHPHAMQASFKPSYDQIVWHQGADADELFDAWCEGRTGYPLVDAASRQLNQTGYMHNRLRMVSASFLVKDLGIDWRRGEAYFAEKLNDFDLAANNGGWQWAASTGCDAQPYFRVFNPLTQSKKFDANGAFIRRYVPELAKLNDIDIHAPWLAKPQNLQLAGIQLGIDYPFPVVDHAVARQHTLARYVVVKATV